MVKFELKKDEDYKVEFEDFNKMFIVSELNTERNEYSQLRNDFRTMDDAEKYIEDREKRRALSKTKKKEPLLILKRDRWGNRGYVDAKITSIDGDNAWVVTIEKGERSKEYGLDFFKNTEENKQKITKIEELKNQIEKIESSIERYTVEEVKQYFDI